MTDALAYPIGPHEPRHEYTAEEREAFIARLAAQPAALAAALSGLPPATLHHAYRPGGWTVQQVVHHMADSHMNMFIRIKLALSVVEPTILPYDQDAWAHQPDVEAVPPMVSVALLAALHERLVVLLRALTPYQFLRAIIHPENGRMSIEQVLGMYAWHGDHHIAHIMALRQREGF